MDRAEFERCVKQAGAQLSPESLRYAVRHYTETSKRLNHESVRDCVQLAGLMEELQTRGAPAHTTSPGTAVAELPPSPTTVAVSEHLVRQMQPWVDGLRKRLVGTTTPPCESLEAAIEWCQTTEPEWLLENPQVDVGAPGIDERLVPASVRKRWQEIETKQLEAWQRESHEERLPPATSREILAALLTRVQWRIEERGRAAWDTYMLLHGEPPLALLEHTTREAARITGFSQGDLAAYVLTGAPPCLPAGRVQARRIYQPDSPYGVKERVYVVVEFCTPDVSFEQFRMLHRQVRWALHQHKVKALSEDDQKFLRFVEQYDGPTHGKGAKAYWERFLEDWNNEVGTPRYAGWPNPKRRYERLQKKLQELSQ